MSELCLLQFHDLGCRASGLYGTEVLQDRSWHESPCHDDTCVDQATRQCQYTLYNAGIHYTMQVYIDIDKLRVKYLHLPLVSAVCLLQVSKQEYVLKGGFKEEKSNSFIDPASFFAKGSSDGFCSGACRNAWRKDHPALGSSPSGAFPLCFPRWRYGQVGDKHFGLWCPLQGLGVI